MGIAAGVVLVLIGADAARSLVFGVEPVDPGLVGLAVVLVVVGMAASFLPAHRAACVEPLAALRAD